MIRFKFTPHLLLIFLSSLFFLISCNDIEEFPTTPVITFKGYKIYKDLNNRDTALILTIEFKDGDGDIGLGKADTLDPFLPGTEFYYNMFVDYYEFIDTAFFQVTPNPFSDDTIRYLYRLPDDIIPTTNNKAIKGEIDLKINDLDPQHNPIKFSIYIYDRKLNKSNVVESPSIIYNP